MDCPREKGLCPADDTCFDLIKWLLRHGDHLDTTGLADQRGAKRRTARDRRQQGEDCHYSQGGKRDHCSDGTFGIEFD